jgi:hypothetical protein
LQHQKFGGPLSRAPQVVSHEGERLAAIKHTEELIEGLAKVAKAKQEELEDARLALRMRCSYYVIY